MQFIDLAFLTDLIWQCV